MNLNCLCDQSGFSLIETLFAMMILAVGLMAVGLLQIGALKGNADSVGRTDAVGIAQSLLDDLRARSLEDDLLKDYGGTLNDGQAAPGGAPNPAEADHSLAPVIASNGGEYTVFWNVDNDSPFIGARTVRMFVYWTDQQIGNRRVVMTTVLGGLY